MKVWAYSSLIGKAEKLDTKTQSILEAAAVVHDIGIKPSEEKYNSSAGKYQELEGPAPAKKMLTELGFDEAFIERVCFLVAHHHTYTDIDGTDYQILIEADFIVNAYEDELSHEAIENAINKLFKTEAGKYYLRTMYL
jgi:HD superfamily phosphodiesterase